MKRAHELDRRLRGLETLREAVSAMKSLAAHHVRACRAEVAPARAYRDGVERLAAWAAASLPPGAGAHGLLVVGAELGLCGGYNARIVAAAAARRAELGPGPTVCVGRRAAALLARRGVHADRVWPGPASVRGIPDLLLALAEALLTEYAAGAMAGFDVVSSRFAGVGVDRPEAARLLPLVADAPALADARPVRYVGRAHLAAAAARELLYIRLYDLLLDALAAEHGARLVATQAAERWLDEQTDRLRRHLAAARREASTQEVIEIAAGARARARAAPA